MKLQRLLLFVFLASSLPVTAQQVKWTISAPGMLKAEIGKPEAYNLLTASGAKPYAAGLEKPVCGLFLLPWLMLQVPLAMVKLFCVSRLDKEEQLYGFGLNFQTVHQRRKILQLHVDHYGGKDNGQLQKSQVPKKGSQRT